jgi:hypothetical protein
LVRESLKKPLALLLTLAMCLSLFPMGAMAAEDVFNLVKNVSALSVGDQIIIVAAASNAAMSTIQNTNNRAQAAITKDGENITATADVQVLTLEAGTVEGTFALNTGSGYLYAAGGTSNNNYLRTQSTKTNDGAWSIEISSSGIATIKAPSTITRNWMRYNSANNPPLFACYGSGQADISIYKKAGDDPQPATQITVPTAVANLKYSGNVQTGVAPGTGYTLTGNTATNAGAYTAIATLATGYEWDTGNATDPRTINWSIAKADALAAPLGLAGIAPTHENGADGKITGTTAAMEYSAAVDFSSPHNCLATETTDLTAGIYYVRLKGDANHEPGQAATVTVANFIIPGTVAIPTAFLNPAAVEGNKVLKGTQVTLTSETPSADIYYTLDNSEPTSTEGSKYEGPITITDAITIKAKAVKDTLTDSEVVTYTYEIVKVTAPVPSLPNGSEVITGSNTKVTFTSATSGASFQYKTAQGSDFLAVPADGVLVDGTMGSVFSIIVKAVKDNMDDSAPITLTYTIKKEVTPPVDGHVVINQVYGGGNSGALYSNDFVELYNPTNVEVDLTGWSVQNGSATGNLGGSGTGYSNVTSLSGKIAANGYYLIQLAAGTSVTDRPLPTPDATGTANLGATAFKIALMDTTTPAGVIKPTENLIDYVGAGTDANAYEGTAPASAPSNATAIVRKTDGVDTDDNAADFKTAAPSPRNTKSGGTDPGTVAAPAYTGSTTVLSGTKVKFTCATNDAKIEFSKTSADATDFAEQPADGVEITGNVGAVIKVWVKASKQDMSPSAVKEFTFTIKDPNAGNVKTVKEVLALPNPGTTGVPVEVQGELVYRTSYPDGTHDGAVVQSVVDGKTYSLFVYKGVLGDAPYAIGDTVKLTGMYKTYSKLPEMDGYTAEKLSSATPSAPAVKTIAQAKAISQTPADGDIGSYILLKNVTIGATTTDSSGKNPNTAITDSTGTMNIYNAATEGLNVGDVVDIRAVVVVNNSTVQLRTGTPALNGGNPVYIVGDDVRPPVITLPAFLSAAKGQDYIVSVTITDNVGVAEAKLTYTIPGGQAKAVDLVRVGVTNEWKFTIPAGELTQGGNLVLIINAKDTKPNAAEPKTATIQVIDLPQVTDAKPTGDMIAKKPTIEINFTNAPTATARLTLKQGGATVVDNKDMTVTAGKATYAITTDLEDGTYTATVVITRSDSKSVTYSWNFTVGEARQKFYFGQLHSHTAEYSDGSGTLAQALNYIKNTAKNNNVQFVAFTDHSNYFDSTSASNAPEALYDASKMTPASKAKWDKYKGDITNFNAEIQKNGILALGGFEMTWSGGPGHINTFNTPGLVSRNNTSLNSKSLDAGMKLYYETLKNDALKDSVSQFNHPGKTFGTFTEFAYWDKDIDKQITLIEVGNGEGQIGADGYFPSYSEYTKALDKGWHVAPTNNQDNHKGNWGDANDARTVILADSLSEADLYKAMRERKVYATEDKNLSINYTVNDYVLGSIVEEKPAEVKIKAVISDPDTGNLGDKIAKVEVIGNSGIVVKTWTGSGHSGTFEATLTGKDTDSSYYYLRVTQADKNIAVTAPVWLGAPSKVGISFSKDVEVPVTGEMIAFTTKAFNDEETAATVESIRYELDGKELKTESPNDVLVAGTEKNYTFEFTPERVKDQVISVTVTIITASGERVCNEKITLEVLDGAKTVYVGLDGAHQNEYIRGNYKDQYGSFAKLAAGYNVRVVELRTDDELIAATTNPKYKALFFTPPTRRNVAEANYALYSDTVIAAVKEYAEKGGTVIVSGYSDAYETNNQMTRGESSTPTPTAGKQMSDQQNKILAAIGSKLRISDDGACDKTYNPGGDVKNDARLYLSNYNLDNPYMSGIVYNKEYALNDQHAKLGKGFNSQVYSQYAGTTIYAVDASGNPTLTLPDSINPMVYGYDTTISVDFDQNGKGGENTPKYPVTQAGNDVQAVMTTASESILGGGTVIVAGGTFFSDFEVKPKDGVDSNAEMQYANVNIVENLIASLNMPEITAIDKVQAEEEEGIRFTIEGTLTSNVSGFDKDTAFFDCAYLQDATGGVNIFPISGNYQEGQKVRITGTTSSYQGERQLAIKQVKVLDKTVNKLAPTVVTTKDIANNTKLGLLVKVEGVITSFAEANGAIQTIMVRDSSGIDARVFIDGYITGDKDASLRTNLAVGNKITVVGLASYDNSFDGGAPRIRVRDRDDIECKDEQGEKLEIPIPSTESSEVISGTKITFDVPEGAKAVYKTTEAGDFIDVPSDGVTIVGNGGDTVKIWVKATKVGAMDSDEVVLTYTVKKTGTSAGTDNTPTIPTVKPDDVKVGEDSVEVKLAAAGVKLNDAASEKLISANADKPVHLTGGGLNIIIPAGTLSAGADVNAMLVNPKAIGSVIKVTRPDGTIAILPIATVSGGQAAYVANISGKYEVVDNTKAFPDTGDHWALPAIGFVSSRELFKGDSTGAFSPDQPMTRGMLATVLSRIDGGKVGGGAPFADVPTSAWYAGEISWAAQNKLVEGDGKNFNPDSDLTREQLCVILVRYLDYSGLKLSESKEMGEFSDLGKVSSWSKDAMELAVKTGLISGKSGERLDPQGKATRAEIATILQRFVEGVLK